MRSRAISPWRLQRRCAVHGTSTRVGGMPRVDCGYAGRTSPVRTSPDHALRACRACGAARASPCTLCDLARSRRGGCSAAVHHLHPSEGCRALTLATRDEPAQVRHLQTTLCACAALVGSPGSPIHVVRSRAISPWRLQRRASPPPVGGMPRIDSTLTLATRDEPARFGHLQFTLCAPSEPVGSPGSLPSTSSAISLWWL